MPYNRRVKKICVIGLWHLGCVLSSCLAEAGYKVVGTDFNKKIIDNLKKGIPPLYEPGLEKLIKRGMKSGNLNFVDSFGEAIQDADFIFLAFDTKVGANSRVDLTTFYKACHQIASLASGKFILIICSQIPIGTSRKVKELILKSNKKLSMGMVYNPENLRLGRALTTFRRPDRIIIGTETENLKTAIDGLYFFIKAPKIYMALESAEMVKHAINSYLANSISFINEIADLCEVSGADVRDVIVGMKSDRRIGHDAFLGPGLGFGGVTLGRDLRVLRDLGRQLGTKTHLLDAVAKVNENRKKVIFNKVKKIYPDLNGLNIGILGLTYKPGTNVLRGSMAIELSKAMVQRGVMVKAFDPTVKKDAEDLKILKIADTPYEAAKNADLLILATNWPEFKRLNFKKMKKIMKKPIIIDCKNFLEPTILKKEGFTHYGIGFKIK